MLNHGWQNQRPNTWPMVTLHWQPHRNRGTLPAAIVAPYPHTDPAKHTNAWPNCFHTKTCGTIVSPISWCFSRPPTTERWKAKNTKPFCCTTASDRGMWSKASKRLLIWNVRCLRAIWRRAERQRIPPIWCYTKTTSYRPRWCDRPSNCIWCIFSSVLITRSMSNIRMRSTGQQRTGECR